MKKYLVLSLLIFSSQVFANNFPAIETQYVSRLWIDIDRFTMEMKNASGQAVLGVCGSGYFAVKKTYGGYDDFYAAALMALASSNLMNVWVTACEEDINIVTGGSVIKS